MSTKVLSVRVDTRVADRIDELGEYLGSRSDLIGHALTLADKAMRITELLADGVSRDDHRVKRAFIEHAQATEALARPIINKKRRPGCNPDGAKTSSPWSGEQEVA